MQNFGGEMTFGLSTGERIVVRGAAEIMPSNVEITGAANQDGSVYRTVEPTGFKANLTFEDLPTDDWNRLMRASGFNVTLNESFTGVQHLWTEAAFTGTPTINRASGEVTGVALIARVYRKI
ncbi:phage tail tube protein [Mesorhizobium sp. M1156]|uniref:phage tail tube protein n=1 Tax=Mesorhizobium sp. M1156 TaxID=2957064 RepID=UPI003338BAD5